MVTNLSEGTGGIFEFSGEFYFYYLLVDWDSLKCCLRKQVAFISDKIVNTIEV